MIKLWDFSAKAEGEIWSLSGRLTPILGDLTALLSQKNVAPLSIIVAYLLLKKETPQKSILCPIQSFVYGLQMFMPKPYFNHAVWFFLWWFPCSFCTISSYCKCDSMSVTSDPSDKDDTDVMKLSMDEKICQQETFWKSWLPSARQKCLSWAILVLVIALLFGTVCACIAFALEISSLKSEIASLQRASSSLQSLSQQLNGSFDEKFQHLNSLIDLSLKKYQDINTQQLNASFILFNQAHDVRRLSYSTPHPRSSLDR